MPRRKPKHLFQPGQSGNKSGRPPGATNKILISEQVREAFAQLLEGAVPHLEDWLLRTAQKNPDKALDLWVRISERFVPSLQRVDHNIEGGNVMIPIQINLPQMPSVGAPPQDTLPSSPAEVPKGIEDSPPTSMILPRPVLTPNMLRDMEGMGIPVPSEFREGTHTGGLGEIVSNESLTKSVAPGWDGVTDFIQGKPKVNEPLTDYLSHSPMPQTPAGPEGDMGEPTT